MNRLRNSTFSSMGIKSFFMLGRNVGANAGDQVKAPLPESLQQQLGNIALISKDLPLQSSGHLLKRFAVVSASIRNSEGHDLDLVIDEQMDLEAKEPAHGGWYDHPWPSLGRPCSG